jgi:cell division protein FtsW
MNVFEASYLLRYLSAVIVIVVAAKLLYSAIRELAWAMRHSLRPAQGIFLLNNQTEGEAMSLPLYHTTSLGRGSSNDIRIHSSDVARKHAQIYRYDGDWYIRPQRLSAKVEVNGEELNGKRKLENRDTISLGGTDFVFVDERAIAKSRGETYEEAIFDDRAFYRAVRRNSNPPYLEWVMMNLFTALCTFLLYFMIPKEMGVRKDFLIWTLGAVALIDLYFLILPKILLYADRILYLTCSHMMVIGLAIQARLHLLGSYAFREARDAGEILKAQDIAAGLFSGYRTQIIALLIGLFFLWIIALIVYKTRFLESMTLVCAILTPLLLLVTLILGRGMETHGANLWIYIGGQSIQLTEFAKITFLITLASFFKNQPPLRIQIYFAGWAAGVFLLYLLLPDLGSIMILLPVTLLVFVVMTSEYLKTFLILVAASVMSVLAYSIFPHVRSRISGWTSIWTEVNDSNRQVVYGLQAIGRGEIFGRGLGNGSPGGIPLVESDMVFTVLLEEFGLIMGLALVIFLFVIMLRATRTTVLARDGFSSSLALGLGAALFMEAFVVIGGTTGLIPLTGVTLPFIAQGGSSLLAKCFMLAILLGLASRHEEGANRK